MGRLVKQSKWRTERFDISREQVSRRTAAEHERIRAIVEDIVGHVFDIEPDLLRQPTRGQANVALARQVSMYLVHIGYGLSLTEVGTAFQRDRTTVSHACLVVEQRRDKPAFDRAIGLVERIVRAMCGATGKGAAAIAAATGERRSRLLAPEASAAAL